MAISRRNFLERVGQAGGFGAAFLTMQGMGLMPTVPEAIALPPTQPRSGKGKKVLILGGGIAGLVSAYELRARGYECTVLEARERPGGRNWTMRSGNKIVFMDGSSQECTWDKSNYQNFGPARLPSTHRTILGYCRKLGVELQVEVNTTRSSHLQNDAVNGGKPFVQRQVINDTRGHVSELLMKCASAGNLDQDISAEDRARMLDFLRIYGPLDSAGKYIGSDRAGFAVEPGAGNKAGVLSTPVDMHTLLEADFWQPVLFAENFDMQATMFQPVGGMDRIPYAFAKALGDIVQYSAPVSEIRKTGSGVRVTYKQNGQVKSADADYCFCAMPLTILKNTPNDFGAPYKKVIEECSYVYAYKVAWESRRFWEQDDNVYGGLEFVSTGPSPIWFPSAGLLTERGVLVSGYTNERGTPFEKLSLAQKFAASRGSIERLHPGRGRELEKPMYVGWGRIPYNEGSWVRSYGPDQERAPGLSVGQQTGANRHPIESKTGTNPGYETLIEPDGPIYFVGDHVSHIVGWQEGAATSALRAVQMLEDKRQNASVASQQPMLG